MELLKQQLDSMVIGGLKLHANLPKHERGRTNDGKPNLEVQRNVGTNKASTGGDDKDHRRKEMAYKAREARSWNQYPQQQTKTTMYVSLVALANRRVGRRVVQGHAHHMATRSQSSLQLNIPMEKAKWLNDAWVGRLKKLSMFDRLEDEIMWEGREEFKPKYLGDDMVLLLGLNDSRVEGLCSEDVENGWSLFHSLEKWNQGLRTGYRLAWIMCWGIPIARMGCQ